MNALIDSSAWVEYIRGSGSPEHHRVRSLIDSSNDVTTDPVLIEVVGGGRSGFEAEQLTRLLSHSHYIPQMPHEDVLTAIDVYQRCRSRGETVRSLNDCLIAAIALRAGLPVLHRDRDFDVIARHTDLEVLVA